MQRDNVRIVHYSTFLEIFWEELSSNFPRISSDRANPRPTANYTEKMVCEHDDFGSLVSIIQRDIPMRMWVLVGADRACEKCGTRFTLALLNRGLSQTLAWAAGWAV